MIPSLGITDSIKNFLRGPVASVPVAPPTPATGAGLPAVWEPPTIEAPPNASLAVLQATEYSTQLEENTDTGAGTGAGRSSFPITRVFPEKGNYFVLIALAFLLVFAYAWDKGKL